MLPGPLRMRNSPAHVGVVRARPSMLSPPKGVVSQRCVFLLARFVSLGLNVLQASSLDATGATRYPRAAYVAVAALRNIESCPSPPNGSFHHSGESHTPNICPNFFLDLLPRCPSPLTTAVRPWRLRRWQPR